jgi:hypothetical protein
MSVAEQITNVAEHVASVTGERKPVSDTPLQIRMNPFMAAAKRGAFFEPRIYLVERATSIGLPQLFTQEAANLMIDGSRGSQRDLRGIAQFAFFAAASEGASRIESRHAVIAIESWSAQNANAVPQKARPAVETARQSIPRAEELYGPPQRASHALVTIENKTAIAAPPASDAEPPAGETALAPFGADDETSLPGTSPSLIRRQVASFIEAEARHVPTEIQSPKRRWIMRSVQMTAVFLALFGLFGMISAQMHKGNSGPAKRAFAVQVQQADLTAAVVQPPAPPPTKPVTQGYVIPEPVKEVAAVVAPPAPTPPAETVETAAVDANPAPDEAQDQVPAEVPAEDRIKSETEAP